MMKSFSVSDNTLMIKGQYPSPDTIAQIACKMDIKEVKQFLRLWLTEGIPFAFQEAPILFEVVREWLAGELKIHPKEITLIGSGRIGFSLSPPPDFGKRYDHQSDLDFTIISNSLFDELCESFNKWETDYRSGNITPKSEKQKSFWKSNIDNLPNNIRKGFIDSYKIPNLQKYAKAQELNNIMWKLKEKLLATPSAPSCTKASVRVYKNWDAFICQLSTNIRYTFSSL